MGKDKELMDVVDELLVVTMSRDPHHSILHTQVIIIRRLIA